MEIIGGESAGFAIADTIDVSSALFWDLPCFILFQYISFWHYLVGPAQVTCGFVA